MAGQLATAGAAEDPDRLSLGQGPPVLRRTRPRWVREPLRRRRTGSARDRSDDSKPKDRSLWRGLGIATVALGGTTAAVGGSLAVVNGSWWLEEVDQGAYVVQGGVIFAADDDAAGELLRRRRAQNTGLAIFSIGVGGLALGTTMMSLGPTASGRGIALQWRSRW